MTVLTLTPRTPQALTLPALPRTSDYVPVTVPFTVQTGIGNLFLTPR